MAPRRAATKAKADLFFLVYANMGPARSLTRVHETAALMMARPPAVKTLKRWSVDFGWNRRARDFDDQMLDRALERSGDEVMQMNRRQAQMGRAMQGMAGQGLQALAQGKVALTAHETARLARDGVHMERLAEGQVTDRVQIAQQMVSLIVHSVVALFTEINVIDDPDGRRTAFAAGADKIVTEHFPEIAEGRAGS